MPGKAVIAAIAVVIIAVGGVAAYLVVYAPGSSQTTSSTSGAPLSVNIEFKSGIGNYLANGTGFALYYLSTDMPYTNSSTCSSSCLASWPPFYAANLVLPPSLSAKNFTTITTANGGKQLTFDGYPLYYWIQDTKAGDVTGNGVAGFHVVALGSPPFSTSSALTSTTMATTTTTTTTSSTNPYGY